MTESAEAIEQPTGQATEATEQPTTTSALENWLSPEQLARVKAARAQSEPEEPADEQPESTPEQPADGDDPEEAKLEEKPEEKPEEEEKQGKLSKAWRDLNRGKRKNAERFREVKRLQRDVEAKFAELGEQRKALDADIRLLSDDPQAFVEKRIPGGLRGLATTLVNQPDEQERLRLKAEEQHSMLAKQVEELQQQLKQRDEEREKLEVERAQQNDFRQMQEFLASKAENYQFAAWYDKTSGGEIAQQIQQHAYAYQSETGQWPDFDELLEAAEKQVRERFQGFPGVTAPPAGQSGEKPRQRPKTAPASTISHTDTSVRAAPPPRETREQARARLAKKLQLSSRNG